MKTVIKTLLISTAFAIILGLTVIWTGMFNVATSWKDPSIVRWVLVTTRENSIRSRASSIVAPKTTGATQVDSGFRSYREMCAVCHTPPGGKDSPIAQGLNPEAPALADSAKHMSSSELFWVIKNGIRMTGMPAWGPTHKDVEIWGIVAFLKKLPGMKKEQYDSYASRLKKGHSHAGGAGHGDSKSESGGHGSSSKKDDHGNSDSKTEGNSESQPHGHGDSTPAKTVDPESQPHGHGESTPKKNVDPESQPHSH